MTLQQICYRCGELDDYICQHGSNCDIANNIFRVDDGGRSNAGYRGLARDCTVRAIAIATELPYKQVYDDLFALNKKNNRKGTPASPRDANTSMKTIKEYLSSLGWTWTPTMTIGSGCQVHLKKDELPEGRVVVRVSKHMTTMIDGVIHDIFNPDKGGKRAVYGYFKKS